MDKNVKANTYRIERSGQFVASRVGLKRGIRPWLGGLISLWGQLTSQDGGELSRPLQPLWHVVVACSYAKSGRSSLLSGHRFRSSIVSVVTTTRREVC